MCKFDQDQINRVIAHGVIILADVNETMIRTGVVEKNLALEDVESLFEFRRLLARLAKHTNVSMVFISGNTFEYLRKMEEPLGVRNLKGLKVGYVSENGLIARMGNICGSWQYELPPQAQEAMEKTKRLTLKNFSNEVYLQGNEVRLTFKPNNDRFDEEFVKALVEILDVHGEANSEWGLFQNEMINVYSSPHYIDIDPRIVVDDGVEKSFLGKEDSTLRILDGKEMLPIAFGDSKSDEGMFSVVVAEGGRAFQVANSIDRWRYNDAILTKESFGKGVNEAIRGLAEKLETTC